MRDMHEIINEGNSRNETSRSKKDDYFSETYSAKEKIANMNYNYGNASDIGYRKGEGQIHYEQHMDELTGRQEKIKVSVLYKSSQKDLNTNHMNIIESHQNQVINDAIKEQENPVVVKGCFQRVLSRFIKFCT